MQREELVIVPVVEPYALEVLYCEFGSRHMYSRLLVESKYNLPASIEASQSTDGGAPVSASICIYLINVSSGVSTCKRLSGDVVPMPRLRRKIIFPIDRSHKF